MPGTAVDGARDGEQSAEECGTITSGGRLNMGAPVWCQRRHGVLIFVINARWAAQLRQQVNPGFLSGVDGSGHARTRALAIRR